MKNLTWMARHPQLYRRERKQLESRFPGLKFCETAFHRGVLLYHGEIDVRTVTGTSKKKIILIYPNLFPTALPAVMPVENLPESEPHESFKAVMISARHQMQDGSLCSVERDPFQKEIGIIRGIDILRRAAQWFFSVESGHNPHDSVEADLESHLQKSGDILLGPEFYSDELNRGGHFYFTLYPLGSVKTPKFIGLAFSSDFENIPKFKDCRQTLQPVFPWIRKETWDTAENMATNPENFRRLLDSGQILEGFWWDLKKEPPPPRTGFDILRLICDPDDAESLEEALRPFSTELNYREEIFIGLRYPHREEGFDWLVCCIHLRGEAEKNPVLLTTEQKLELLERSRVSAIVRHPIRRRELMLRNQGRVPANISEKSISLFGVGSVGSSIAELLAKAGIGELKLFDFDKLKPGNVIRHQSGLEFFGEPKVSTTYWNVVQHNPFIKVGRYQQNLSDSYEQLEKALSETDLVISSTANEPLETVVNEVAVMKKQTVYYVRAMRGGAVGRIFRVIPGTDACRYCLSRYIKDSSSDEGRWLEVPEVEDTLVSFECGNPILAASGIDLTVISALCSKIVLQDIENNFGQNNHWLWSGETIDGHPALSEPYKLTARQFTPRPDCPFCSKPPVGVLIITPAIKAQIEKLVIESGKNETGGILVGYFDAEKNAVVTAASEPGPNAVCTPAKFLKDADFTQKWLEDQIRSGSRQIEYIGEWHSHTNSDTTPSITDTTSLNGIAVSPDYLCKTPVMLIFGSNGAGEIIKTSGYGFAQDRPFQEIEYKVAADDSGADDRRG